VLRKRPLFSADLCNWFFGTISFKREKVQTRKAANDFGLQADVI
jgi:hypothetical protein